RRRLKCHPSSRTGEKPAVRNDRGDRGDVGIIRSPVRASILPDCGGCPVMGIPTAILSSGKPPFVETGRPYLGVAGSRESHVLLHRNPSLETSPSTSSPSGTLSCSIHAIRSPSAGSRSALLNLQCPVARTARWTRRCDVPALSVRVR